MIWGCIFWSAGTDWHLMAICRCVPSYYGPSSFLWEILGLNWALSSLFPPVLLYLLIFVQLQTHRQRLQGHHDKDDRDRAESWGLSLWSQRYCIKEIQKSPSVLSLCWQIKLAVVLIFCHTWDTHVSNAKWIWAVWERCNGWWSVGLNNKSVGCTELET